MIEAKELSNFELLHVILEFAQQHKEVLDDMDIRCGPYSKYGFQESTDAYTALYEIARELGKRVGGG